MKIICFGDSVTRGISYVKGRLRIIKENYPALLQKSLLRLEGLDEGDRPVEIINKGVFNDNSGLLLNRLDKDVIALAPDYVLIEIGGNDCNFRWDEVEHEPEREHEPIVDLKHYVQNIQDIIDRIKSEGAVPILMNLLPLDPGRYYNSLLHVYQNKIAHWIAKCGGIEHWHGLYNRELVKLMNRRNILSIDIRTLFKAKGNLLDLISDDGIHPTSAGYLALSECILVGLSELGIMSGTLKNTTQPIR